MMETTISRDVFRDYYEAAPAWDIEKPQQIFVDHANQVTGSVLDLGCGTGEHTLFFAERGHPATGIDFLEGPIIRAKQKALKRHLDATFLVEDVLSLQDWPQRFDCVIDSGLFHVFSEQDRAKYVSVVKTLLKPGGKLFLLCFSNENPAMEEGPKCLTKKELQDAFSNGWNIESIQLTKFEVRPEQKEALFSGAEPQAWFLKATKE
jgi:cyclopropane fatty-acyl-phospholipid synthase-like methyltransferase